MSITRIEPGPRLSSAVVHGGKVYLAGVVADSTMGQTVANQTADILAQIDDLLKQAGTDKTKLLKVNIWLSDIGTMAEMNRVWDGWVSPGNTPARATVEAKLASPDWAVEIMVEAAV